MIDRLLSGNQADNSDHGTGLKTLGLIIFEKGGPGWVNGSHLCAFGDEERCAHLRRPLASKRGTNSDSHAQYRTKKTRNPTIALTMFSKLTVSVTTETMEAMI